MRRRIRNDAGPAAGSGLGVDEAMLLIGLVLLVTGIWPIVGVVSLTVPGIVLLWLAIPSRAAFIVPPVVDVVRKEPRT